jgi:hypothetical protein
MINIRGKTSVMSEDQASRTRIIRVLDQFLQDRKAALVPIPKIVGNQIDVVGRVLGHLVIRRRIEQAFGRNSTS